LEISALFSIPFLWFAQNSVENSIGLFGVRDKSFYMSFKGLSTVFLLRRSTFYRETKIFHFGSEIFSRCGWKLFTLTLEFSAWDSIFSPLMVVGDHTVPLRDRV
jgi:hypothetical protein